MYCYTITIDEQGMTEVIADTEARINNGFRKSKPFAISRTEEILDPATPQVIVSNFHLVTTGDVSIKNDKQAGAFCAAMFAALEEVQKLNDGNYIVIRPPRRAPTA